MSIALVVVLPLGGATTAATLEKSAVAAGAPSLTHFGGGSKLPGDTRTRSSADSLRGQHVNRNELVDSVAGKADLSKSAANKAVDAVFESITDALKGGGEVRLVGFGTFSVAARAASEGRNPRTGEKIRIAASKQAKFKPGKRLRDELN
jgi:DNA-binding protein HU-beta